MLKPSTPPPNFGIACGAKVPSTPATNGLSCAWMGTPMASAIAPMLAISA